MYFINLIFPIIQLSKLHAYKLYLLIISKVSYYLCLFDIESKYLNRHVYWCTYI